MIGEIKTKLLILRKAVFDQRCPLMAKLIVLLALAYLLSPVDLIPDFIPVLGWLDDLVLIPLLLKLAYAIIPHELIEEYEHVNQLESTQPSKLLKYIGMLIVLSIWISVAYLIYYYLFYTVA